MHLVGFTIEIYYDARSYKRQRESEVTPKKDLFAKAITLEIKGELGPCACLE